MFQNIYGLDLGTYEIKVYDAKREFIWKEKNVVAKKNGRIYAAGDDAWVRYEKTPPGIAVEFPMQSGAIARFNDMQQLLVELLKKERPFSAGAEYLVAVPTDVTEVEKRAFYDLVSHSSARAKSVRIAERGIVEAIGLGMDIFHTEGAFVIDMGGGVTELSVLSYGGLVMNRLLKTGGIHLDLAIQNMVRHNLDFLIGKRTAEMLRMDFGVFGDETAMALDIPGRDLLTGLPRYRGIPTGMVRTTVKEVLGECMESIRSMYERTPPHVRKGIEKNGIYLTGGLAHLKELSTYMQEATGLKVKTTPRPEFCVVEGLQKIIEKKQDYRKLTYAMLDEDYRWLR